MAVNIRYTPAERQSFELVPETCPTVEAAIDKAFASPDLGEPEVQAIFAKYGLTCDRKTRDAIYEVLARHLFPKKQALFNVVLYDGTMPLRLALVRQIEAKTPGPHPETNYERWIASERSSREFRARPFVAEGG